MEDIRECVSSDNAFQGEFLYEDHKKIKAARHEALPRRTNANESLAARFLPPFVALPYDGRGGWHIPVQTQFDFHFQSKNDIQWESLSTCTSVPSKTK